MDLTIQQNTSRSKIHPYKFALWAGCASILMMFASLTSAYIVRQAAGNWLEFSLPEVFKISTAVILLSSVALHGSYIAFKRENETMYKALLVIAVLTQQQLHLLQLMHVAMSHLLLVHLL